MTSSLKATRPDHLTENETLKFFEDWHNQLEVLAKIFSELIVHFDSSHLPFLHVPYSPFQKK